MKQKKSLDPLMLVQCFFVFLIAILMLLSCQPTNSDSAEQSKSEPEPVVAVVSISSLTDSSGMFTEETASDGSTLLGSTAAGQWLQFDLAVPEAGRYRTEIIASQNGEDGTVWIEDYVDNPDGRAYNITGAIPVAQAADVKSTSSAAKEGSPLNAGTHKIKLHFNAAGIFVQEIRFTLMRKHVKTPVVLTQDMSGENWELAWSDEFDGTGIPDTSKWTFDVGDWGWGNNELQYYTEQRSKNARLENGNLIIEAHKNDDGNAWTSARLTTRGKVTFKYGKIEFRAKVPTGRGNWAAGWTLGDSYVDEISWPYCGEIDIMESVGYEMDDATGNGKAHASVHCRAFYFKEDNHYTSTLELENMHETFHVYGVVWTPEGITAYVDDEEYFSYSDLTDSRTWPFSEAQNIILNLAMGGGWGGAEGMDETLQSQQMVLDYVRVYARK